MGLIYSYKSMIELIECVCPEKYRSGAHMNISWVQTDNLNTSYGNVSLMQFDVHNLERNIENDRHTGGFNSHKM